MTRICNECGESAEIDMLILDSENLHQYVPCCSKCAIKLHRKPRNKGRVGFYLRKSLEIAQVERALVGK